MKDEKYTPEVGAWLKDREVPPPDSQQSARRVAARLPQVRQRRRWWPLIVIGRAARPSSAPDDTSDHRSATASAANAQTPTITGRTSSMLSPVKAIAAGALVFAIAGAFLFAQPFQQTAVFPGAETEPIEPTWVTGTGFWAPSCTGPESSEVDGDVTRERGSVCEPTRYEMSDPRLSGEASWRWNTDMYQTADGQRAFLHGATFLRNDGGGWTCPVMRLQDRGDSMTQYNSDDVMLCTGDGGYEGLSALVVEGTGSSGNVQALIFSGDAPPLPDPPSAE